MNEINKTKLSNKNRTIIFIVFLVGLFISGVNAGFIGPVLPIIENTLQVSSRLSSWVYTTYLLLFVIGSPILAKISENQGKKKAFIISLLTFLMGTSLIVIGKSSIICIIIGRWLQGFGGGGIHPVASAFVGDYYPPQKRGMLLGIVSTIFGFSTICGPLLASFIIPFGWEWLFIINIPMLIILIIFSYYYIPNFETSRKLNIDKIGSILLIIVASSLSIGINQIDSNNFIPSIFSKDILLLFIVFIVALVLLIKLENRSEKPIVPIHMFKNKDIKTATEIIFIYGLGETIEIYIPSFTIVAMNLSYTDASLLMLPSLITFTSASLLVGKLTDKYGSRILIKTGLISLLIGLIIMLTYSSNMILFIIGEIFESYGLLTIVASPIRYIVLCETSFGDRNSGQAILNMSNYIARIIGGALIGGLIASFSGTIMGYNIYYIFIIIMAIIALILSFRLKNHEEQLETMYEIHEKQKIN